MAWSRWGAIAGLRLCACALASALPVSGQAPPIEATPHALVLRASLGLSHGADFGLDVGVATSPSVELLASAYSWSDQELLCTLACGHPVAGRSYGFGARVQRPSASGGARAFIHAETGVHRYRTRRPGFPSSRLFWGVRGGGSVRVYPRVHVDLGLRYQRIPDFHYLYVGTGEDLVGTGGTNYLALAISASVKAF